MIKVLPWDHIFLVITGKNNMLPKTDHNGFSHNDQKIWCFGLSRILYILYVYIYYDYIHIYDATLHAPFSDPDGLPKKDPKSAVPTQAKAAWMPRRDEITQWPSHENRGI